jgi:hypothetical protein
LRVCYTDPNNNAKAKKVNIMRTVKFAAYDDQAIWGVGDTSAAAITDAKNYHNNTEKLKTAEMTAELADLVADNGGCVSFGILVSGELGTADQQYDEA